jgi:polysaccharide deacetylase family protein (PEP-CTERM system associated)
MTPNHTLTNAMTVDVEDYFQVAAFESRIQPARWDDFPQRVADNTSRILDLFAKYQVKATFFTLGWVAERNPGLIKRIVAEGHELASHGYRHVRVTQQTPEQFRQDVRHTKALLEDLSGQAVIGYRAACYSIGAQNLWALAVLQEEGYRYSSSIYPVRHDLYGMPGAPRFKFVPDNAPQLLEIPVSTVTILGRNLPCGGGGFFRLYPYAVSRWALRQLNQVEQQPGIFYLHPWEIDPEQPRVDNLPWKSKFRHYLNLHQTEQRLERLCQDFAWDTMQQVFLEPHD